MTLLGYYCLKMEFLGAGFSNHRGGNGTCLSGRESLVTLQSGLGVMNWKNCEVVKGSLCGGIRSRAAS